jgi:hypothetical protein
MEVIKLLYSACTTIVHESDGQMRTSNNLEGEPMRYFFRAVVLLVVGMMNARTYLGEYTIDLPGYDLEIADLNFIRFIDDLESYISIPGDEDQDSLIDEDMVKATPGCPHPKCPILASSVSFIDILRRNEDIRIPMIKAINEIYYI